MPFRQEAMELVRKHNYKKIVEIGVWKGELSRMFYKVADSLILIDPWQLEHIQFVVDELIGPQDTTGKSGRTWFKIKE